MADYWSRLTNKDLSDPMGPGMAYVFSDEGIKAIDNPYTRASQRFKIKIRTKTGDQNILIDPRNQ